MLRSDNSEERKDEPNFVLKIKYAYSQEATLPITELTQNQGLHLFTSHQKGKQLNRIQLLVILLRIGKRAFPTTKPI